MKCVYQNNLVSDMSCRLYATQTHAVSIMNTLSMVKQNIVEQLSYKTTYNLDVWRIIIITCITNFFPRKTCFYSFVVCVKMP